MQALNPVENTTQLYLMLKRAEVASEDDLTQYHQSIALSEIKTLNLSNHVSIPYLICISQCIFNLKSLSLERCDFGDEGANSVSLHFPNLKKLSVRVNNIGVKGVQAICVNLKNLRELDLGFNNIGEESGFVISKMAKNLIILNLERNKIGDDGILRILKNLKQLIELNVNFTNLKKKTRRQNKPQFDFQE